MQSQVNTIEYQLPPALCDKLVLEELEFRIGKHKWRIPTLFGLLVAVFLFWINHPDVLITGTANLSIAKNISAFVIEFCIGFVVVLYVRKRVRSQVLESSRKCFEKLGSSRKFMWDNATLTMIYPMLETKIKWQIVEKIVQEKVGIHFFVFDRIQISIPKELLPPNMSADELVSLWSTLRLQTIPPAIKR
jgi:hypothetical protein